jgi:hypothetical protein
MAASMPVVVRPALTVIVVAADWAAPARDGAARLERDVDAGRGAEVGHFDRLWQRSRAEIRSSD